MEKILCLREKYADHMFDYNMYRYGLYSIFLQTNLNKESSYITVKTKKPRGIYFNMNTKITMRTKVFMYLMITNKMCLFLYYFFKQLNIETINDLNHILEYIDIENKTKYIKKVFNFMISLNELDISSLDEMLNTIKFEWNEDPKSSLIVLYEKDIK